MLGRHPDVASTPETLYLLLGRFQLAPAIAAGPEAVAARIHQIPPLRRLARDRDALAAALTAAAPLTEAAVFAVLLASFARASGARRVVEKTPLHLRHIDTIRAWFPDAQLVWILRDGRACVASLRKMPWASDNPAVLAAQWVRNMAFALDLEARAGPALTRVRYEALTADPVAEMDRIQDFLGLPRSAAVHDHTREVDSVKGFERGWKENIGKPIITGRAEAWKRELAPALRRRLAGIMDPDAAPARLPAGGGRGAGAAAGRGAAPDFRRRRGGAGAAPLPAAQAAQGADPAVPRQAERGRRIGRVSGRVIWRQAAASRAATSSAMASEAVRPGLSMPKRLTRPGSPCVSGPSIRKSVAGPPAGKSFGRMPA